jgi:acylpyruvate hydrolase
MRLVSYSNGEGEGAAANVAGVLVDGRVIRAQQCAQHAGLGGDSSWGSVKSILEQADRRALAALDAASRELVAGDGVPREDVMLGPPVPDPEKVLCIGLNYHDHVEEAQQEDASLGTQADPVVFSKFATALVGDGADVVLPAVAPDWVDWEGELAVVIGRTASRVSKQDALEHVAGYMAFNDISARDLQLASPQWLMGKSFDTAGPCGPALVTADEIPDPQALDLRTEVNGEVVQSTNTAMMINPVARLIEYISSLITLHPGDVLATGTPGGVGFARDPKVFLQDGDVVTVTISDLGQLSNPVRAAKV